MSKWSELYESEILETTVEKYIEEKLRTKKTIINLINKYATNHKVMEFGSGTGVLSLHVSSLNNNVTAVDMDQDMIDLSKKYFLDKFDSKNIKYICGDIRDIKIKEKYDVCYSIGVLEHYSDSEIIDLINKQLSFSRYVIFAIPTKYFDEDKKMYGNERYLPLRYWRGLIKQSNARLIEESSYHYLNGIKRLLNFKKIFKPNPVHIFVVEKN